MKRAGCDQQRQDPAGDVIVGLSSYGQATYENAYNGGMGSNGLTSARHDVLNKTYRVQDIRKALMTAMPDRPGIYRK